jgi:hypothetical protein
MKVWITKYALTKGVFEAEVVGEYGERMIRVKDASGLNGISYYHGQDVEWCATLERARNRAAEMRDLKLQSLRKQIAKLEKMEF